MDNKELIGELKIQAKAFYAAGYKNPPKVMRRAAKTLAANAARIAELESALVQSAIPIEALLIAETTFPFLAPSTITRLEVALRSINELLPA